MSRWFRLYADAMRNPKVMRLADKDFRLWIRLLAVASENDGLIPPADDLKLVLSMRLDHLLSGLKGLISGGLIDALDGGYQPHNWAKFQYKSDTSSERVAKHRAKCNVTETPPDTETETERKKEESPPIGREGLRLVCEVIAGFVRLTFQAERQAARDEIVAEWNAMATTNALPLVSKLTDARRVSLDARIAEHGREACTEAINRIAASPMCRGENGRGWKANFDFLLQPSSFLKLIEGNYDGNAEPSTGNRPLGRSGQGRVLDRPRSAGTPRQQAVAEIYADLERAGYGGAH